MVRKILFIIGLCLVVGSSYAQASSFGTYSGGGSATTEAGLESDLTDVTDVFTNNDGALDDDDVTDDNVESMATAGAVGLAPLSDGATGLVMMDVWTESENTAAGYLSVEVDPNALLTAGTDNVKGTHIDWGAGAFQVDLDDVPDSVTYAKLTVTKEAYIDQDVTSGSTPTFTGTNFSGIPATGVELVEIGAATYDDVQDWSNITQSSGIISGFTITDSGGGEIDVAAGTGIIKSSTTSISQNLFFDYAGQINQNILTDNSMNFIYINYNAGTPVVAATVTRSDINQNDEIGIGRIYRSGTDLKILSSGVKIDDDTGRTHKRLGDVDGFVRASGGGTTVDAGGNDRIVSASGTLYYGLAFLTAPGIDTTAGGGDTFTYMDNNGGTWEALAAQTTIDYAHYDDGDGTVGNVQANKYGIHWLYFCLGTEAYFLVYGTYGTDTLSDAQERNTPAALPDCLANMGFLVAKIIVKQDGTDYHVFAPWETAMSGSGVSDHGNLAGLTDDDHPQYGALAQNETITGNWANTDNPWADNEVADDISLTNLTQITNRASTDLTDTADILYEAELDTFGELQTQIADKTLVNEEDAITLDALLTANLGLDVTGAALTSTFAGNSLDVQNTTDAVSNQVGILRGGNRTAALNNDEAYLSFYLDNEDETQTEFARMTWIATDVTDASKDGWINFEVYYNNVFKKVLGIAGTGIIVDYQLYAADDLDTKIGFGTPDRINFYAGGQQMFHIIEGATDYVGFNKMTYFADGMFKTPNFIRATIDAAVPEFQIAGSTSVTSQMSIVNHSATGIPKIIFGISDGATYGTWNGIVADDDEAGQIVWMADDGTDMASSVAMIEAELDDTVAANDTPGRLVFYTTPDGSNVCTESMRLDMAKNLTVVGVIKGAGYKSSDGSAGVTGATCSAWKDGLCTAA